MENFVEHKGQLILTADALIPIAGSKTKEGRFGILGSQLKAYGSGPGGRAQATALAQLYRLVIPGLILTRHVFQGLRRPLFCDGSPDGHKSKWVYTRKPQFDFTARVASQGVLPTQRHPPPDGRTFFVVVSPNEKHAADYPMIDGWIEHWNWVEEDPGLAEAPIRWTERYDTKLWTRQG